MRVLFREPEDYAVYLTALNYAKRRTHLKLYHYCLLRDEIHLVVGISEPQTLSTTLHDAHLAFRWHHRKKYRTSGSLWHDRFHHATVKSDDLLTIGGEVECLSVRAGLTTHPADYPHSSYTTYALGQPNPYLDTNPLYIALAPTAHHRQETYWKLATRISLHLTQLPCPDITHGRASHVS